MTDIPAPPVVTVDEQDYVHIGRVLGLLDRSEDLVKKLLEAEVQHGGLVGGVTLRARDELRRELSLWGRTLK